jgi:hypothetical protein
MWSSTERTTGRYGYVGMYSHNVSQTISVSPYLDTDQCGPLLGKRVRLTAKVLEARNSGHDGDRFLKIKPSTPDRGEEIELGVGVFSQIEAFGQTAVGLEPNDGREFNWIDPRVLYRLHDQTVELYVEETEDAFTPDPNLVAEADGVISTGDGAFQFRGVQLQDGDKILPKSTRLGPGLFALSDDFEDGERVKYSKVRR